MMKYNAMLIRFSEIAIKSKPVRSRLENILIRNIADAMKKNGVKGRFLKKWGRIIIETEDCDKLKPILTRVFGIVSFSPSVKIDLSSLQDFIKDNAKAMVTGKTFAVRVNRSGKHNFTSKDMEIELGSIVVNETKKKVNLSKPDNTIFVEIRDDVCFVYSEIVKGVGGMPLGSEDSILCHIKNKNDLVACWLMMKRGCKPIIYSKIKTSALNQWSYGLEIKKVDKANFKRLIDKGLPIIKGTTLKEVKAEKAMTFLPLVAMKKEEIRKLYNKINIKENT